MLRFRFISATVLSLFAVAGSAQVTPAAGYTPPDDTPSFKVGATIFSDYTYVDSPTSKDADSNVIHFNAFNVGRAYINVTGNLNHRIAFRITPDISRETGSGSSLAGSQNFRLKYAFGQFNLDDWMTKGSWVRFGLQQTPYIDYTESIYRYRFQGSVFAERIGYLTSSDAGLSGHYALPSNFGDLHAGFYNGEGYTRAEANNEKAFQIRGTLRPLPMAGVWKGLRVTGFYDDDHVVQRAKRQRAFGQVTFEHPWFNTGFEVARATDQPSVTKPEISSNGWSGWVTPRFGPTGWELLLRHDEFKPNKASSTQTQKRDIAGIAYWVPNLNKVTLAFLGDYDSLKQSNFSPVRPKDTRYGLKMLINF
ncbi:MAG: hypothetical protein NVSMB68_08710 [Thermoanaerobaculia bacterium]